MRTEPALALLALALLLPPPAARAEGPGPAPAATPAPVILRSVDGSETTVPEVRFDGTDALVSGEGTERRIPLAGLLEGVVEGARPEPDAVPGMAGVEGPPRVQVDLVRGDSLRGVLVRGNGEIGFVLRSDSLGEVSVDLERVVAVRFPVSWSREEAPPTLVAAAGEDVFHLSGGDRLQGTLRSVDARSVTVRSSGGVDRVLATKDMVAFVLAAVPPAPEEGLRVQLLLRDGSRISGTGLGGSTASTVVLRAPDGERPVPAAAVLGFAVRGGDGTSLSSLPPAAVEIVPHWPDGAVELLPRPAMDRAVSLQAGSPPPLMLGDRFHARGVSMYSGTTVTWDLGKDAWSTFRAFVGVDDGAPRGAVEFEVLLDGKSAWRSGPVATIPRGEVPVAVPALPLKGVSRLALRVHAGPGDDVQDCADWVRAVLVK